ncbi:hypothetical protein DFJ74DRAFT_679867 [Hyaloraphidium curvatum]|nr:hypothetical protein DFJ74DRAFT_679867 [Hyaloraphidium curvatum]
MASRMADTAASRCSRLRTASPSSGLRNSRPTWAASSPGRHAAASSGSTASRIPSRATTSPASSTSATDSPAACASQPLNSAIFAAAYMAMWVTYAGPSSLSVRTRAASTVSLVRGPTGGSSRGQIQPRYSRASMPYSSGRRNWGGIGPLAGRREGGGSMPSQSAGTLVGTCGSSCGVSTMGGRPVTKAR